MHTGTSYTLFEFLAWTRRTIYVLVILSVLPVVLYDLVGWKWIAIPWGVVFLLGTTVALSAGFKNIQTFNRAAEAQQVWATIAASSRNWGALCRDFVADPLRARELAHRHLAWLTTLRYEMRRPKAWESAHKAYNVEYARRYSVPEREVPLETELAKYMPRDEASKVLAARSKPLRVLEAQSRATLSALQDGMVSTTTFADMQKMLRELQELQGRTERIKEFPYPRQHAFIHTLFVRILCVLLPMGMISEFERLNDVVDGWAKGHMVWLGVPLALLICWMYTSLDQVSESTENPFEGGANDVPITQLCQDVEADLRQMLGEPEPAAARAADHRITM